MEILIGWAIFMGALAMAAIPGGTFAIAALLWLLGV